MFAFLMVLFVVVCFFLALFILLQQGKGDMGLGSLAGSSQLLFGGSGGQDFFEKITWTLGAIFLLGALGLSILAAKQVRQSALSGFSLSTQVKKAAEQVKEQNPVSTPKETEQEESTKN